MLLWGKEVTMPVEQIDTAGEWVNCALFWLEGLTNADECNVTSDAAYSYICMAIQSLENAKMMLE